MMAAKIPMNELPAIFAESNTLGSCLPPRLCGITGNAADCLDDARSKQTLHHQEADQTGQTGSAVVVIRQTHGSADGEQPSHVVDQGAAGLAPAGNR